KRHHYIRRAIILDVRLLQRKGSLHRLFRKNHSSEIGLLQELNKATRYRRVVADNIEKYAAAVPSQHDVSWFGFTREFGRRCEARIVQDFSHINRSSERGESMLRHNKDVCGFARFAFI